MRQLMRDCKELRRLRHPDPLLAVHQTGPFVRIPAAPDCPDDDPVIMSGSHACPSWMWPVYARRKGSPVLGYDRLLGKS
jgi:hypothetical protein